MIREKASKTRPSEAVKAGPGLWADIWPVSTAPEDGEFRTRGGRASRSPLEVAVVAMQRCVF